VRFEWQAPVRGQRLDVALLRFRLERRNRFAGEELGHIAGNVEDIV